MTSNLEDWEANIGVAIRFSNYAEAPLLEEYHPHGTEAEYANWGCSTKIPTGANYITMTPDGAFENFSDTIENVRFVIEKQKLGLRSVVDKMVKEQEIYVLKGLIDPELVDVVNGFRLVGWTIFQTINSSEQRQFFDRLEWVRDQEPPLPSGKVKIYSTDWTWIHTP